MTWERTGSLEDGTPSWQCSSCGKRSWGQAMATHACDVPAPRKLKKADLPCQKRGLAFKKVGDAGCGCSEVAYSCSLHDLCTINKVKPEIRDCVSCVDRVA